MGYYYEFHFKAILKKETPNLVTEIINLHVNRKEWPEDDSMPDHEFFTLRRWSRVFSHSAFLEEMQRFIPRAENYWLLELHTEINYGYEEIQQFVDWISPYVAGRKQKQYVGWYKGEDDRQRINLYVQRTCISPQS
jgi:hypothetical protein